jgi:hypothetical protein
MIALTVGMVESVEKCRIPRPAADSAWERWWITCPPLHKAGGARQARLARWGGSPRTIHGFSTVFAGFPPVTLSYPPAGACHAHS